MSRFTAQGRLTTLAAEHGVVAAGSVLLFAAPLVAGSFDWLPAGTLASGMLLLEGVQLLLWRRAARDVYLPPVVVALLALACLQLLTLTVSVNPDSTLKALVLTLAGAGLALFYSAPRTSGPGAGSTVAHRTGGPSNPQTGSKTSGEGDVIPPGLRQALWPCGAVVAALLWDSVTGIREYAFNYAFDPSNRIFGTFFNPDINAGFLSMALPLCLCLLLLPLPRVLTPLLTLTAILGTVALALTGSKGGWLSVLVGAAAMAAMAWGFGARPGPVERRRLAIALTLSILVALAFSPLLFARISKAGTIQAHSTRFRVLAWKTTVRMMIQRPVLGFGAGAYPQAYPKYAIGGPTETAHSSYLQAGAEMGAPGILLLLIAAGSAFWPVLHCYRLGTSARDGQSLALASGLTGGLAAGAVHNLIDFDWSVAAPWLLYWGMAGVLWQVISSLPSPSVHPKPTLKGSGLLLAGVLLSAAAIPVALSAAAAFFGNASESELGAGIATLEGSKKDPAAAVRLAGTAMELDPLDGAYPVTRAEARRKLLEAGDPSADAETAVPQVEADYLSGARLRPTWAKPYYHLGTLLESRGRLDEAVKAFHQALDRDPHLMDAELHLARIAAARKRLDEARMWLQKVADTETSTFATVRGVPEDFDPHYLQGWVALAQLDAQAGQWSTCAVEADHALQDLHEYARLASAYVIVQQIWTVYRPLYRTSMVELEQQVFAIARDALTHLGRKTDLPGLEKRHREFADTMAAIHDPVTPQTDGTPAP